MTFKDFSLSNKSLISLIISQFFNNIIYLIILKFILLRFFVTISLICEKINFENAKLTRIAR